MQKYDFVKGEMVEVEATCDLCGEPIEGSSGYKIQYVENEDGEKEKLLMGSCCVGKIHATGAVAKQQREAYKSRGQIPDDVLARNLPKAPPPNSRNNNDAGKKVHQFLDAVGRSKLSNNSKGKVNLKKRKRGMGG